MILILMLFSIFAIAIALSDLISILLKRQDLLGYLGLLICYVLMVLDGFAFSEILLTFWR